MTMRFRIVLIPLSLIFFSVVNGITKDEESLETTPVITVTAVGDIMMGTDYPSPKLPKKDGKFLFEASKEILRKADIIFGNQGISSTKKVLDANGIKYSSKSGEVAKFEIKGVKIGLVALSFGSPPRSIVYPEKALEEIEELSKKYDLLILSIHGGKEGGPALETKNEFEYFLKEPRGNLIQFAHEAIDRGADLILGHGPHVPRAMEIYQDRLIAYSFGNFCTSEGMGLGKEKGYAPLLWMELGKNGAFIRGKIYSFIQVPPGGPKMDEQEGAYTLIKKLSRENFPETSPFFSESGIILPREKTPEGTSSPASLRR